MLSALSAISALINPPESLRSPRLWYEIRSPVAQALAFAPRRDAWATVNEHFHPRWRPGRVMANCGERAPGMLMG